VTLDHFSSVAPVWRPLLQALGRAVDLCWDDPGTADTGWFPGRIVAAPPLAVAAPEIVSCADPHAEVVEALRWVRELLATGVARPEEVAICAPATEPWDEHFLVLATAG
jgi:hypothetical protein